MLVFSLITQSRRKRKDFQSLNNHFYFFFFLCSIDKIISLQKPSVPLFYLNKSGPNTSQQFLNFQLFLRVFGMLESIRG